MASLLKLALEGQLGGMLGYLDTSNGQSTGSWLTHGQNTGGRAPEAIEQGERQDLVELKGPLAIQLGEALAQMYNKNAVQHREDADAEEANPQAVATESQANDALMQEKLIDDIRILTSGEEADNSTTIYGVDAEDVKPEDIVEVSQGIDAKEGTDKDYVVILDGNSADATQRSPMASALENLCEQKGVRVFYSMEALRVLFKK